MKSAKTKLASATILTMVCSLLSPITSTAANYSRTDSNKTQWVLVKEAASLSGVDNPDQIHLTVTNTYKYDDAGKIQYVSSKSKGTDTIQNTSYLMSYESFDSITYDKNGHPSKIIDNYSTDEATYNKTYTYKNDLLLSSTMDNIYSISSTQRTLKKSYVHDKDGKYISIGKQTSIFKDLKTNETQTEYYYDEYYLNGDKKNYTVYSYSCKNDSFEPSSNNYKLTSALVSEFHPRETDLNNTLDNQFYPKLSFKASKENVIEYNSNNQIQKLVEYANDYCFIYDNWKYDANGNPTQCDFSIGLYNKKATVLQPGLIEKNGTIQFTWEKLSKKTTTSSSTESKATTATTTEAPTATAVSSSESNEYCAKNIIYRITKEATSTSNTGEVTLVRVAKKSKTVTIPASIQINNKTYNVTTIAADVFQKNTKLKKLTIGENVKTIGKNAFNGCKNLKTIKISTTKLTKKTVGKNAFAKLSKKAKITVPKKKLKAYKKLLKSKGIKKKTQSIVASK